MQQLTAKELFKLEDYAAHRPAFRQQVMTHKKARRIAIGDHLSLYFEDRLTVQYQVQEMLRIERIFELEAIEEELAAYNPLIPDGCNWKATCMIEYSDETERRKQLQRLGGIEHQIWIQVAQHRRVYAIADEDLQRTEANKTSAVHFLRFELSPTMIAALARQDMICMGVNHQNYTHTSGPIRASSHTSLCNDLD